MEFPALFGTGLARTAEDARLQADGLCIVTHPLLGRCGQSVYSEVHHLVERGKGGHDGPQGCVCKGDHDVAHPGPGGTQRYSLVVREADGWTHVGSGQEAVLDDAVLACVELGVPPDAKPGAILGLYRFGSVIRDACPHCGNAVPRHPDRWMDTSASGEFMRCPRCLFTYHGWVHLLWPQVEAWWEQRAVANHDAMKAYTYAREELDWSAGKVLADMANGRLWTLMGANTMTEYAQMLGRAPQTLKNNLRAERLIRGLHDQVQDYARQLPVSLINARGGKLRDMTLGDWQGLVAQRDEEATVEQLKGAIDELAARARDIDKPSGDTRVESEVEVFGDATTFIVRVKHFSDMGKNEIIAAAQRAILKKPGVVGVEFRKKGHQVKDVR